VLFRSCLNYSGGIARYEGDNYYRKGHDVPGNPWFITTLWLVQYYIAIAKEEKDKLSEDELINIKKMVGMF
jgi:GH15 family glucan-1,4-alpha-glucosidase